MSAGDDVNGGLDRDTAEIYEPPYLFKGPRPTISTAPATVQAGTSFDVETPTRNVTKAVLIAPGAVTHAVDMNQRVHALTVAQRSGGVRLDGACQSRHRSSGLVHALPGQRPGRALGGEVRPRHRRHHSRERGEGGRPAGLGVERGEGGARSGQGGRQQLGHPLELGPHRQPVVAGRPRQRPRGEQGRAQLGGRLRAAATRSSPRPTAPTSPKPPTSRSTPRD